MSMNNETHRIECLIEIGRELSSAADLDRVLQSILTAAVDLTSSETASVLALDEESNTLRFLATPSSTRTLQTISVPLDRSIAGMVFSQKKIPRKGVSLLTAWNADPKHPALRHLPRWRNW